MKRASVCVLVLLLVAAGPAVARADSGLLRTSQALDEARGYCLDIAGFAATLRLDDPLQAHTCKYGGQLDDQRFEIYGNGALKASLYNRCLAATALEPGARLMVRVCAAGPTQRWTMAWGRLSPDSRRDLCVSVAPVKGEPAGTPALVTPVYRRRDVMLERCDDAAEARQAFRWSQTDERGLGSADAVRGTMPADVAKQLAAFGTEFDGDIAAQTAKIYASQPRVYEPAEIKVTKNVAYGPHERQQMDVHVATLRRSEHPMPVVIVFHGGGLVGGSRASTANVADYFASLGYVGVNGGYRLAPEAKWPEGARDVGAAVTWLKSHAAEYGGDPEQIFVMGLSTGAYHAATYVFMPDVLPPGTARPAGAILLSGPYSFDFESPSKGELEYFGKDRARWPDMVIPGHVTRGDIPVFFTTAEWDNARYLWPEAAVYKELVDRQGARPRYRQSLGHNHSSQLLSVGTPDTSVSRELVDFISVDRSSIEGGGSGMKQWMAVVLVGSAIVFVATTTPGAQQQAKSAAAAAAPGRPYAPPKTPWGDPDLQGGWTNVKENGIPLQRPDALTGKSVDEVDDSELAEIQKARNEAAEAGAAAIGGRDTGAGPTHWYEHYGAKNSRAWMVSDPKDGRIPPLTAQAQQRVGRGGGRGGFGGNRADSWLDRSFYDRCITRGFPGSMMPAIYGNAYDITQAPGLVAIRYEMIHETRVIRLDDSPRTGLRTHMGEARGHWEGSTLVVETTNFDPRTVYQNGSAKLTMVERYRPVASDKIEWSVTLNDPDTWTKPWTFGMTLTEDPEQPLFEYACHEGNYAMRNILSAARAEEKAGK